LLFDICNLSLFSHLGILNDMIQFIHPHIRIGIVMVTAFLISGLLMNYSVGETETLAPLIQVQSIVGDFSQSLSNSGSSILSSLQSFRLPNLISISPQELKVSPLPAQEPTPLEWATAPPEEPGVPTSTPAYFPTKSPLPSSRPSIRPTVIGQRPTQPPLPTSSPKPTKTPKPTKIPKPTAIVYPLITSNVRPGSSLEEIMRDVEKRACVPYKFLMAIRTREGGNKFNNMSASTTKMYNTLNWWNTTNLTTVCDGLAYSAQTGLVPSDSTGAGQRCEMAIGDQTYDQKIMGIMQISEEEQSKALKYTVKTIPGKIDRRVLFDNILIFGIISKNRAGKFPQPSCTNWPQETVMEVARIHASGSTGSCEYYYSQNGASGNYCKEIWDLYKSFK